MDLALEVSVMDYDDTTFKRKSADEIKLILSLLFEVYP